jgi:hypothetical protein
MQIACYPRRRGAKSGAAIALWLDAVFGVDLCALAAMRPPREDLWSALSAWICRGWNAAHVGAQRLEALQIAFVLEEVRAPGAPRPRTRHVYFDDECR